MVATRYRAFVSYSHADRETADWLHRKLEAYRVPNKLVGTLTREGSVPRKLTPIFMDRDDLPTAGDLSAAVDRALGRSLFLIVLCSPAAARSEWVDKEIRRFKAAHGDQRVLAVIADGEPYASETPGGEETECFPRALRYKVDSDGAITDQHAEPLAADIREEFDGKKYGLTKIVAGLIGVGLDDLIQREHHRRHTKMQAVAGATSAAALVMGALTWIAVDARNEATMQKNEAEGLVEFMLTDLKEKLDAVGRLDALQSTGERALQYYAAQDADRLDPDSLGRRARAQLLVGEIDNLRGDLDAALKAYMEAAATTGEQLKRDPNNEQRIFDHAQSVFWVGYIAWQRGDAEKAETQFREYLRLAEQLVEIDPENPDWQAELGYAYNNLGTLLSDARRWDEAIEFFERSKTLKQSIVTERPSDIAAQWDLAQAYSWIASAQRRLGRWEIATSALQAEITFYRHILDGDPSNTKARRALAIAQRGLGRIAVNGGKLHEALSEFQIAEKELNSLLAVEPENKFWLRLFAHTQLNTAQVYFFLDDERNARTKIEKSLDIAHGLVSLDDTVLLSQFLLASAELTALKNSNVKSTPEFAKSLQAHINKYQPLFSGSVENNKLGTRVAEMHYLLGTHEQTSGDASLAHAHFENAAELIAAEPTSMDLEEKTLAVKLLVALDRKKEAMVLINQLNAIDYRHPEFVQYVDQLNNQAL